MNPNGLTKKISYLSKNDREFIQKALEFARQAHEGQKRLSGEEYVDHPVVTAEILADLKVDATTIGAGLLHDTLEDTAVTPGQLKKEFGEEIVFLVNAVSKLSSIKYQGQERKIENFRKMFLAMAKDVRVMLIKLADRLHNMRTIKWLSQNKQESIARETFEIYAPLAGRLGMGHIKGELEDLCFPILYPTEHQWLKEQIGHQLEERKTYLEHLRPILEQELQKEKIPFVEINLRAKHYWSLYRKLQRYDMDWSKIHDLIAARIIVPTITDCYLTLGIIHKLWRPLPNRIKDFIAFPRPSGYQSLHTAVFTKNGMIVEFQIRTGQMHEVAEKGIAAHWIYDEFGKNKRTFRFNPHQTNWIRQLCDWQKTLGGNQSKEYLKSLKIDFFQDRIFVFTPRGDVIDLPEGATSVDFAYQIHSDIGNACAGARVNGKMVALSEPLENNDIVEIITAKNKKPSADWLTFVKTSEARRKIQQALKTSTAVWHQKQKELKIQFRIGFKDRIGLLKDISAVFSSHNINIFSSSSGFDKNKKDHVLVFNVSAPVSCDIAKIAALLRKIKSVQRCDKILLS